MRHPWLAGILAIGLAGCGSGISGEVGGERVSGLEDALFDEFNFFGFEVTLLWLSDASDSCGLFDDVFESGSGSCADICADLGTLADTHGLGDDAWTLALTMRVDGATEGTYAFDSALDIDTFTAEFLRWDVARWSDQAQCVAACEGDGDITDSDSTSGSGGELIIDSADDSTMSGSFSVDFSDGGSLDGSFSATSCDMADWLAR